MNFENFVEDVDKILARLKKISINASTPGVNYSLLTWNPRAVTELYGPQLNHQQPLFFPSWWKKITRVSIETNKTHFKRSVGGETKEKCTHNATQVSAHNFFYLSKYRARWIMETLPKKRGVEEKTLLYYSSKVVFKLLYSHIDLSPFFLL